VPKTIVIFLVFFAFQAKVSAVGGSLGAGDGGQGVFCRTGFLHTHVELLDLYEARIAYGIKPSLGERSVLDTEPDSYIRHFNGDGAEAEYQYFLRAFKLAQGRLEEASGPLAPEIERIFELVDPLLNPKEGAGSPLPTFGGLPIATDLAQIAAPAKTEDYGQLSAALQAKCRIGQLATFSQKGKRLSIVVNPIWRLLSPTDRAALLLHELFHLYFRNEDTRALRQFVAYLAAPAHFRRLNRTAFQVLMRDRRALPKSAWHI